MSKAKSRSRSYERKQPVAITPIEYGGLQVAYDHFNRELFKGALIDVFITYQRRARSGGHFSPDRFSARIGQSGKHELALNPDGFVGRSDEFILSVLVHEQCHVWQHHCAGHPAKRGYHDRKWAAQMKAIGLQPSSTGQRMAHYVIPGGAFQRAYEELAATGWALNLQSAHFEGPRGERKNKSKFTCPRCGQNAWGKPELAVVCKPCGVDMRDATTPTTRSYEQAAA